MLLFLPPTFCINVFCVDGVEKVGIPLSIYNYKRSVKESLNKNINFIYFVTVVMIADLFI